MASASSLPASGRRIDPPPGFLSGASSGARFPRPERLCGHPYAFAFFPWLAANPCSVAIERFVFRGGFSWRWPQRYGGPIVEGTKFVGLDVHKELADSRQFTSQGPAWRGALILDPVVSRANRFLLPNVSFWVRIIID